MNSIGFYLQVQKSTILHSQSGKGVFIFNEKPVPPGTLIGFYPGIIYDKEAINKIKDKNQSLTELPYLIR